MICTNLKRKLYERPAIVGCKESQKGRATCPMFCGNRKTIFIVKMLKILPATEIVVKAHDRAVTIVGRMTDIVTGSRSCSVIEA